MARSATLDEGDLALLESVHALTHRRVLADVAEAWRQVHGHLPAPGEWAAVRTSVARLERIGLVRSEPSLHLEVTDSGRRALAERDR
jgi:hypothetical protein